MTLTILKTIKKIVQVFLIILLLVVVNANTNVIESKILNDNYNKSIDLNTMALKLKEDIENDLFSAKDSFTGDLTAYYATCPLCSGHLACLPNYDVLNGTVTYQDISYGNVRIVASSKNLPCGSIIRFNKSYLGVDSILAIVLDRGVLGNDIDLLTVGDASMIGRSTITYDVLRNGWQ